MKLVLLSIGLILVGLFVAVMWRQILVVLRTTGYWLLRLCKNMWIRIVGFVKRTWIKIKLSGRLWWTIRGTYPNHCIASIFAIYIHFYKTHIYDIQQNAYDPEYFPHGHGDLVRVFEYITKIRKDNWLKYNNIDVKETKVRYGAYWWSGFKVSFKKNNSVDILPYMSDSDHKKLYALNSRTALRLRNELHKLDNDVAKWIIDRRQFFTL